jgi:hypothetical protein
MNTTDDRLHPVVVARTAQRLTSRRAAMTGSGQLCATATVPGR